MNSDERRSPTADTDAERPMHDLPVRAPAVPIFPLELAPPPANPLGQYELVGVLGKGGMGVVYQAIHLRLRKEVAVKVVSSKRLHDPLALARFEREMQAVGRLEHPAIVGASDAGEIAGTHFLVMELVKGANLAHLVKTRGPLRIADACELVRQAALGLQHVHECGLVHRDIKPSNLLLSFSGTVKVSDLGLARLRDEIGNLAEIPVDELTATGQLLGTVDFMAPEQASNTKGVDIRADIYSLGCTLYMLLAGRPPFTGPEFDTTVSKLLAHANRPIPSLRNLRPDVPAPLETIVTQMLAKAPQDRPPIPGRVAELLRPFTDGCDLRALIRDSFALDSEAVAPSHASTIDRDRTTCALPAEGPLPQRGLSEVLTSIADARRLLRPRWLAVALFAAALGGAAALWWNSRESGEKTAGTKPPTAPSTNPDPGKEHPPPIQLAANSAVLIDLRADFPATAELDEIASRADEWIPALKRQPKLALWTRDADESILRYDPQRHSVRALSKGMSLVELGRIEAPALILQLLVSQPAWEGGIGVFFGLHDSEELGPSLQRFQTVTLQHSRIDHAEKLFAHVTFFEMDELGVVRRTHGAPVGDPIPIPSRPQLLEVVVRDQTVAVRLGTEQPPTMLADPLRFVLPADYQGRFGLFIRDASGTFENVRVKFPSREGPAP